MTRGFGIISEKQMIKDFGSIVEVKLPKRGTKESAGYDCFAPFDIILQPNEDIKIPTGVNAYMQKGEVLLAFPRSGLGFKYYCRLANSIGVIDSDYIKSDNEGHMFVKIRNEGDKVLEIKKGDGICQFIFIPFLLVDNDSFDEGDVRNGGFGSTNV